MSTALMRDADGAKAADAFGWPVGYQPSAKYCRTRVADPAAMGVAMDVPRSTERAQSLLLLPLHATQAHGLHSMSPTCQMGWSNLQNNNKYDKLK